MIHTQLFLRLVTLTLITLFTLNLNVASAAQNEESTAMGMVTGPLTGTYIRIGQDIASVVEKFGLNVDVKESRGSIDNIKRINSAENAGIGIVQSDLLGYLRRSKDPEIRAMADNLRMMFSFYNEEIHVLARKDIHTFKDLAGKRLIIGSEGSGHWLTAMNLLAMLDVQPGQMLRLSPTDAVVAVLRNRADAMIFVGGKPVRLFNNLEDLQSINAPEYQALLEEVHFVPLNDLRIYEEYSRSEITPDDYNFVTEPVPTAAVTAVLVSYDFSANTDYAKKRCEALGKIGHSLRNNLPLLQEQGHPKWKEVTLNQDVAGLWEKDSCVETYKPANIASNPIEKELLRSIKTRW